MSEYEVKYLNYWWNRKSVIDPTNAERDYYAVFYDRKGREIKIVKYSKDNEVLSYQCLRWKGSWLVQAEDYSPDDDLQYKITYHYNKLGFLVEKKIISRDGTITSDFGSHEQDIIDILDGWLSPLVEYPVVETRGIINYMKGLLVNRKRN